MQFQMSEKLGKRGGTSSGGQGVLEGGQEVRVAAEEALQKDVRSVERCPLWHGGGNGS